MMIKRIFCLATAVCTILSLASCRLFGEKVTIDSEPDEGLLVGIEARDVESVMLCPESCVDKNRAFFAKYVSYDVYSECPLEEELVATNNVIYKPVSTKEGEIDGIFDFFEQYEVDGDVSKVLDSSEDKLYVVVGETVGSEDAFDFEVGDKIALGSLNAKVTQVDTNLTGRALVERQLRNYIYDYVVAEVCAVIEDIPTGSMPIYMNRYLLNEVVPYYEQMTEE